MARGTTGDRARASRAADPHAAEISRSGAAKVTTRPPSRAAAIRARNRRSNLISRALRCALLPPTGVGGACLHRADRRLGVFPLTTSTQWPAPDRPVLFSVTPVIAPGVRG